jgi:hypothetical protein
MYFCTGSDERKAKNLEQNPQCILTASQNGLDGLDVVIEGHAAEISERGCASASKGAQGVEDHG